MLLSAAPRMASVPYLYPLFHAWGNSCFARISGGGGDFPKL